MLNDQILNTMNAIKSNQVLTARSIFDHNCIFRLTVLERKGNFATIEYEKTIRKTKIKVDYEGNEYLMPDRYSMAPMFKAIPDSNILDWEKELLTK